LGGRFGYCLSLRPIIGGVIIGFTSWRGVFAFSAIFGIIAFIAGLLVLPESSDPKGRKLDLTGLVLGGMALSEAIFAVISARMLVIIPGGLKCCWRCRLSLA